MQTYVFHVNPPLVHRLVAACLTEGTQPSCVYMRTTCFQQLSQPCAAEGFELLCRAVAAVYVVRVYKHQETSSVQQDATH